MLLITKEHVKVGLRKNGTLLRPPINKNAEIHLFGQEVNPETWAISKSDLFMKEPTGRDADNIAFGSTLSNDRHAGQHFRLPDRQSALRQGLEDATRTRCAPSTSGARRAVSRPGCRASVMGSFFSCCTCWRTRRMPKEGGSRVAIIMNGSPLFTGDAGSGESEIRRFILENDRLEALIALPEQLFYNTGIATYVWVVTNRKTRKRKGLVQLIDASSFWTQMRKSLGDKRREIPVERAQDIVKILADCKDGDTRVISKDGTQEQVAVSRIFPTTHFGYRKITVERPLRLNFQASPERIARLAEERGFKALAESKKKGAARERRERPRGERCRRGSESCSIPFLTRFTRTVRSSSNSSIKSPKKLGVKLSAPVTKAILSALSERDETGGICRDKDGNPEPDPELRDSESVPLSESVAAFFEREVKPHVPDAWIDPDRRDAKDGEVGLVGYEINFNRYFYRYKPPRPLEEIEAEIRATEQDIMRMLAEVTGSGQAGAQ